MRQKVIFQDLGLTDYFDTWQYQTEIHLKLKEEKKSINNPNPTHTLIFCEHHAVFTLGRSGLQENLIVSPEYLAENNIQFYKINRGGDITYHGPGQLVGYPILDLDHFFTDIHRYLRYLEESIILTLAEYGVPAGRIDGLTGVWLDHDTGKNPRKICALGVKSSRWVTMHGFAFNLNVDLSYFGHIIPCGIDDKAVTSLHLELGRPVALEEVKQKVKKHLATLFEMNLIEDE
jgi:lipoyl(octanoyl) transferase